MFETTHLTRRGLLGTAAAVAAVTARPAPAQALIPVNAISTQGIAGAVLQDLALRKGFWTDQGLAVNYLGVSDATKTVAALVSGAADICLWSGMSSVLLAIGRGLPLRIVAGSLLFPTHTVFSKRPDIKTVADLKGKIIGVGALGAQLHQVMLALLNKKGVDPSTVTFRNVGSSSDIFRAVVAGTVDAGPAEIDSSEAEIETKFGVHGLTDGHLYSEVPEFIFQAAYATLDTIAAKRDTLVRTLAVMSRTYSYVMSPASKADWITSYKNLAGPTSGEEALALYNFNIQRQPYDAKLVLGEAGINYMQKLNIESGAQRKMIPYDQVVDMSLAKAALARLK